MAQVFAPENPREREQLQGGVSVCDRLLRCCLCSLERNGIFFLM